MQSEESARRIVDIGAERDRVLVTGSLKFDSLEIPGTATVDRGRNRVLFQPPRLGVGAVKHADRPFPSTALRDGERSRTVLIFRFASGDGGGDKRGFLFRIACFVELQAISRASVGAKRLPFARGVVADDRPGRVENRLRGTVILLEANHPGRRIVALEAQDVFDIGAAPAVDGLVFVTHHAEVLVLKRQLADQLVLRAVGVLVFVHQNVAETAVVTRRDVRRLIK